MSRSRGGNRQPPLNVFKNDGSFLEMFKQMQNHTGQEQQPTTRIETVKEVEEKVLESKPLPMVGRRKACRALPVGKVKKLKTDDESEERKESKDSWGKYLEEVKKYKQTHCEDETKCRSLVK